MRQLALLAVLVVIAGCGQEEPSATRDQGDASGGQGPAGGDQRPAGGDLIAPGPTGGRRSQEAAGDLIAPGPTGGRRSQEAAGPASSAAPPAATPPAPRLLDLAAADALATVKAAGQAEAGLAITGSGDQRALEFTAAAGAPWPGIAISPAGAAWNLAAFAGIEASLENLGPAQVQIGLRVDEQGGGKDAWNGEVLRLAPGASGTVRVTFGTSWGKAGYHLDPTRLGRVQIYVEKPGEGCRLRLRALVPAGKAGEKTAAGPPKAIPIVRAPVDPRVAGFAGPAAERLRATGATIAAAADGAAISLTAAQAEVVFRPAQPLDLRDFRQATFAVRNPGATAVQVRCRLEGQGDDRVAAEAAIPAGERREIVVPFASGAQWHGVTPGAKPVAAVGKPFLGAPEEHASVGLTSDAVAVLALTASGAAGSSLVWEGVTAATGPAAVVPAWVGTRPPVPGEWTRILDENFDGTALDTTRWTPRLPWIGPIPWELQCYSDQNVSVADGFLRIHCEKRTTHLYENPAWPVRDYATGAVTSYPNWRFRYGYAEARMQLPKAIGLWPAFWTMPDRGPEVDGRPLDKNQRRSTDRDGMEIDIFEHPNRFGPFRYNVACHWDGYGAQHKSTGSSRIYSQPDAEGFVVAGFLWEEGRITWYCNGEPVGTWADPRVASVPMSLKFTVQMGGWAGNEVEDAKLPEDFRIDWVRVWQRK